MNHKLKKLLELIQLQCHDMRDCDVGVAMEHLKREHMLERSEAIDVLACEIRDEEESK